MELPEKKYNLMQKYLRDDLSEKEKSLFEVYCQEADFRKELLHQASILEALEEGKNLELKKFLSELNADKLNPEQPISNSKSAQAFRLPGWFKYAAGILFLVAAFFFWQKMDNQSSQAQLYAEFYQTYPAPLTPRGDDPVSDQNYQAAMKLYSEQQYAEALNLFNAIAVKNEDIRLYEAICLLELKQFSSAELPLAELVKSANLEKSQIAEWYLCLNFLAQNKNQLFQDVLQNILATPDHLFYSTAQALQAKQ